MTGALDGVRVLDLGRVLAGPFCATLLADLGAEVIRVEPDDVEDRRPEDWEGFQKKYPERLTPYGDVWSYAYLHRNKKAISLNIMGRKEANIKAREILWELVKHADVVVHNFSLQAAQDMGITYDNFKKIKPGIIFAHVTGFGSTGPYKNRVGYDPVAKAMAGIMLLSGPPGPPIRDAISTVDFGTAMLTTIGVVSALYHRQKTGEGQMIETALLRTALQYSSMYISTWETAHLPHERAGNQPFGIGPSNTFQAKDGRWVYISMLGNRMWRRFCRFIGREDLATDLRLQNDWDRWLNRDITYPVVTEWVASQTAQEVFDAAQKIPIPCGLCYDITEVAKDPHIKETGMLTEVPGPEGLKFVVVNPPLKMSATPPEIKRPSPAKGEHNEEIYCGLLGYSPAYLKKLEKEGVI
ncbi:MAG: CoA transferase [Chloroflexota bacterium]|nr:MAG: CoA transferase [Chloroflexota bacterium]